MVSTRQSAPANELLFDAPVIPQFGPSGGTVRDPQLVASAGPLLPATLAQLLGLREVVEERLDPGDASGWANVGPTAMSLIHSMLAGGDSIDDTKVRRAGTTQACCIKTATLRADEIPSIFQFPFWGTPEWEEK